MIYPIRISGENFEFTMDVSGAVYRTGEKVVEFSYMPDGTIKWLGDREFEALHGLYDFLERQPRLRFFDAPLLDDVDSRLPADEGEAQAKAIRIIQWLGMLTPESS